MRAICIARHLYLSEHICSIFSSESLHTVPAVGFDEGLSLARERCPDVVICEYDLLATAPLDRWEGDDEVASVPVIAVSMTRRHDEAHLLDVNQIAGFLYLPTLQPADARVVVEAAASGRIRPPTGAFRWQERSRAERR